MAKPVIFRPAPGVLALLLLTLNGCALVPRKPLVAGAPTAQPLPSTPPVVN